MANSSRNLSYLVDWYACLDQGYVEPRVYQCFQVFCFLLGTPALVWCLWISLSGSLSEGLKPTLVFTINLFAVELVICVAGLLETMSYIRRTGTLLQGSYFFSYLAWICRPMVQTCICVELYLAVAQPVTFLKYKLRRDRVACSTMIWVFSLIYTCAAMTILGYLNVTIIVMVIVSCLSIFIISLCCFFILRVLKQPGPGEVEGGRGGEKKQGTTDPQKKRAFGIVLTNLVILLGSSIPGIIGYAVLSSTSLEFYCEGFPMLLLVNIFSVMISPLLHLNREGKLPCRRGAETF